MKTNTLIYILSLAILIVAIFLAVGYPDSGRIQLIAGGIIVLGFTLNLVSYFTKK
uniref:hypothetical protein n=1 Tax=uncultured Draconibacterium sp. TaxID=1573823 RepID=UPI00321718E3